MFVSIVPKMIRFVNMTAFEPNFHTENKVAQKDLEHIAQQILLVMQHINNWSPL